MKTKHLKSYLPELQLLRKKHLNPAPKGFEDLAAVTADGYRVLAYRGRSGRTRRSLMTLWKLPPSELEFWEKATRHSRRALLLGEKGAILVLGDLMDVTGVLFAARLPIPAPKLVCVLRYLNRTDVALSPAVEAHRPDQSLPDEEACEGVMRLFYYADRILDTDAKFRIGLWSKLLLIAEFVGCRLDETDLSVEPPRLSRGDTSRLTAFLLCTMLELRQMDGRVRAENGERPDFFCRVELERLDGEQPKSSDTPPEIPVLSLPAFDGFSLRTENGRLILEALLQSPEQVGALHAHSSAPLRLRLLFS